METYLYLNITYLFPKGMSDGSSMTATLPNALYLSKALSFPPQHYWKQTWAFRAPSLVPPIFTVNSNVAPEGIISTS